MTEAFACRPYFLFGRPLAGDRWVAEHPEEAAVEEADAKARIKAAIEKIRRGEEASFGDLFALAFTTRYRLNAQDKIFRAEWRRELEDD